MGRPAIPMPERFASKYSPEPNSGCWLWTGSIGSTGYGFLLTTDRKPVKAHRLSWKIHRGDIPAGMCVLHRCDVRSCVNPEHLFLGTLKDNAVDMARKGRQGLQKISANQVHLVRSAKSGAAAARQFGISKEQANNIRRRKCFDYIE